MVYDKNGFISVSSPEQQASPLCNKTLPKACLGSLKVAAHQI